MTNYEGYFIYFLIWIQNCTASQHPADPIKSSASLSAFFLLGPLKQVPTVQKLFPFKLRHCIDPL